MKKIHSLYPSGYGHYKVTISYYGKFYYHITSNMRAVDAYQCEDGAWDMSPRLGAFILYNEVLSANKLGKFKFL